MALRREVVDLIRLSLLHNPDQVRRIRHVAVMQEESRGTFVRIDIQMVNAFGVERRGAAFYAVHDVVFFQKQFSEIAAVLSGDTGNQRRFPPHAIGTVAIRNQNQSLPYGRMLLF